MHTVVFGWFGASAVWFLLLFWRLAKSALPGGAGLRGPGTIRLWLGFICVLTASCTLEAVLTGNLAADGFGRVLETGFGHLLGKIGTPLAMLALLAVSLPWLIGFRWRSAAVWTDQAFGFGLTRGLARRDAEVRMRHGAGDASPSHTAPPASPLTPKHNGRYARPTVWRPPAGLRGTAANGADREAPAAGTGATAARRESGSNGRIDALKARSQAALLAQAARLRAAAPLRQAPNAPQRHQHTPTEPVAPAGWLRDPAAAAPRAVAPPRDGASQAGRRSFGEQRASGSTGGNVGLGATAGRYPAAQASKSGAAARALTGAAAGPAIGAHRSPAVQRPSGKASASARPAATQTAATAAWAAAPSPRPSAGSGQTAARATTPAAQTPACSRPVTTQRITPPASVQETLRSIEENAARWTTMAGAGVARRTSVDAPRAAAGPDAKTSALAGQGLASANREAVRPLPAHQPAQAAQAHERAPLDAPEAAIPAQASVQTSPENISPAAAVHWPVEMPAVELTQLDDTGHAPVAAMARAPRAEVAIDAALAPWEDSIDTAATLRAASATGSTRLTASAAYADAPPVQHAVPALHVVSAATSAGQTGTGLLKQAGRAGEYANEYADAHAAEPAVSHAAESAQADSSPLSNVVRFPGTSAPPVDSPPGQEDRPGANAGEPAVRAPLHGHAPNAFEFRAPAASSVELPTLDLLARADTSVEPVSEEKLAETGQLIEQRLQEFKVPVTVVGASAGPVITRFEVEPALGVRGSQIVGLMKDLSRGLGLTSIRVVETIPGKTCMGLELPNAKRQTIRLSEILEADVYQHSHSHSQLTLAMGKDITGHPVVADLAKAPHMLVAGTTGSGKSVAINAMIVSLLYKATPEEVRLIMIDPKMLELSVYEGIPHLLAPVVTDMKLAANALNWCVGEMEKRYRLMSAVGVRNLAGFNQKIRDAEARGEKLGNPFSLTPEAPEPLAPLPLIVVVIDELADLMMVAGKKIEELIARLAQKARAAGIHLILATQRPSVDVITGLIKANIPTRVAFQVSSKIDSRTILDQMGAESLLGQGDMLFLPPGTGYPQRVHGAFVADEEVHRIVEYLKQFGEPQYEDGILDGPATEGAAPDLFGETPDAEADPLYDEAVAFVVRTRRASISSVQRQLRIGYNRAARLVEQMETAGLVSAMGINGSREVLAPGASE